ncbi:hypothetical protein [Nannocystis sp. SCPEA4]|uniref:hypothetical protein n=1 Tax=Nannocystis sp. SCPEA4 TaxID=2996787 RepID=UPI00226FF289|nr:hypothetical protein [Nannocystis sp. SCPEA4]MCY1062159.1 hypothetical protein [Nannocystis sp. SCPEA4]
MTKETAPSRPFGRTRRSSAPFQRRILVRPVELAEWLGTWEGMADESNGILTTQPRDVSDVRQEPLVSPLPAGTLVRIAVEHDSGKPWFLPPPYAVRLLKRFPELTWTAVEVSRDDGATWFGHVFGVDLRPRFGWDPPHTASQLRRARDGRSALCPCHALRHAVCPEAEPCLGGCGRKTTAHESRAPGYCTVCAADVRLPPRGTLDPALYSRVRRPDHER